MTSSLVPDDAQYSPRDERSRDELMRKSKGMGEAALRVKAVSNRAPVGTTKGVFVS